MIELNIMKQEMKINTNIPTSTNRWMLQNYGIIYLQLCVSTKVSTYTSLILINNTSLIIFTYMTNANHK